MSLVFLKLGGSLITNKEKTDTPNLARISAICDEIAAALKDSPRLELVIGHGSGSFGHHAAQQFHTREGVSSTEEWLGFARVWQKARALNNLIADSLAKAGVPVISFSPSGSVITNDHRIVVWNTKPIELAVRQHLAPLIHGDVIFDRKIGGTILSTEELFSALTAKLPPERILLAGIENGVWNDYKARDFILPKITPTTSMRTWQMASTSPDVTGGMGSKVTAMLELAGKYPSLSVSIFSGAESGNIYASLMGRQLGTCITMGERE